VLEKILINSILNFPDKKAPTGLVDPCTKETKFYENESIRLWDSQGIELSEYNLAKVIEDTQKLINNNIKSEDPDKYIHCIWYCISGFRFENVEHKALEQLINLYDNNSLPIIIVYTFSTAPQIFEDMKKGISEKFSNINFDIVKVLAEQYVDNNGTVIESFGKNDLLNLSINKYKNAIDHVSFTNIKNSVTYMFENQIENIKKSYDFVEQYLKKKNSFEEAKNYLKETINRI